MNRRTPIALALLLAAPMAALADMQLMMVEQTGCTYCAAWHAEVGPEYPLTTEGKAAPLLQQDLRATMDIITRFMR